MRSSPLGSPLFPTRRSSDLVGQRQPIDERRQHGYGGQRERHHDQHRERQQQRSAIELEEAAVLVLVVDDVERRSEEPRLNSSHGYISYAVFCLKKKKVQRGS